jgi:hypothetical protein
MLSQGVDTTQPNWQSGLTTQQYATLMQGATDAGNNAANSVLNAPNQFENFLGDVALAGSVASLAAAGGAVAGAALAGTSAAGGVAGGAITGAAAGGVGGAARSALTGQNIGKGALTGAALGAVGGAVSGGLSSNISNSTGLNPTATNALVKAGTGALTSEITGGNPLTGAITGAGSSLGGATGLPGGSALGGAAAGFLGNQISGPQSPARGAPANSSGGSNGTNMALTAGGSASTGGVGGSTDSLLSSTIGDIGSLIPAASSAYGAQNAAEAVTNADTNAINTQNTALGNINNVWGTQQQTGQGANTALQSSLGLNGQTANPSAFESMPGYQFAVQQGTQATQRQAAAMGSAYTPNTAIAVGNQRTGTAMTDYNTYINQLMGAAGLGTTANQGLQTASQTNANNVSQLQQNQGQAQAYGITGVAGAVGGAFTPNGAGTAALGNIANSSGIGSAPLGSPGNPTPYTGSPIAPGTDPDTFGGGTPGYTGYVPNNGGATYENGDMGFGVSDNLLDDTGNLYCDRRMKEAVARLGVASNGLPLYEFNYKADPEKTQHVGYMADEVLGKYPDAVSVGRKGFLMVNYSKVPS